MVLTFVLGTCSPAWMMLSAIDATGTDLVNGRSNDPEKSLSAFLRQGLSRTDPDAILHWKECHARLILNGADPVRADVALALILARAEKYDDTRTTLLRCCEKAPGNISLLRLLSWTCLSNHRLTEGLQKASDMVTAATAPGSVTTIVDRVDAVNHAGKCFGFAMIVVRELQPENENRVAELRKSLYEKLSTSDKVVFDNAEDDTRTAVDKSLEPLRKLRDDTGDRQTADKAAVKDELEAHRQSLETEASQRRQQAADIEREAMAELSRIQAEAAPLITTLNEKLTVLEHLRAAQSNARDQAAKDFYGPAIATAEGQVAAAENAVQPYFMRYAQVQRTAIGQIEALGMRIHTLGRMHWANKQQQKKNDAKPTDGMDGRVKAHLRKVARLAVFVPLDFGAETEKLLASGKFVSLRLD